MLNTLAGCAAFSILLMAGGLAGGWWWWWRRRSSPRAAIVAVLMALAAAMPTTTLAGYLAWCWAAGQPQAITLTLTDGVEYERRVIASPGRAVVHLVRIDLEAGHRFIVSPAEIQTPHGSRCAAVTTTEALENLDADLAINASFFRPFKDQWFLGYRPHRGDAVEAVGKTISDGQHYGRSAADWPSFCVQVNGNVSLGTPDDQTRHAASGNQWLIQNGQPSIYETTRQASYARTAVGLSADRRVLWLVVVDGKQPRYSDGLSLTQLAALLQSLGVSDAINFDGGGSSTLALRSDGEPRLLSRPCHTKIPRRQRPVANHIGVIFRDTP